MAHKKDVRELLLQKATVKFARYGYLETTTKQIAAAAKVNSALVYYYFKNKEDILYNIIERSSKGLYLLLMEIQVDDGIDPVEGLRRLIRTYLEYAMEQYDTTKIIMDSTDKLKGTQKAQCIKRQNDIYHIFIDQINRIKSDGYLKEVYPEVVNLITMAMMNWLPRWYKKGRSSEP